MKNTTATTFPVYKQRLAGYLMLNGFCLINLAKNEKYGGKNVFYFWDSPEIQQAIKDYVRKNTV